MQDIMDILISSAASSVLAVGIQAEHKQPALVISHSLATQHTEIERGAHGTATIISYQVKPDFESTRPTKPNQVIRYNQDNYQGIYLSFKESHSIAFYLEGSDNVDAQDFPCKYEVSGPPEEAWIGAIPPFIMLLLEVDRELIPEIIYDKETVEFAESQSVQNQLAYAVSKLEEFFSNITSVEVELLEDTDEEDEEPSIVIRLHGQISYKEFKSIRERFYHHLIDSGNKELYYILSIILV